MYGIIYGHLILLTNVPSGGKIIGVQNLHYNEINAMTGELDREKTVFEETAQYTQSKCHTKSKLSYSGHKLETQS